MTDKIREFIDSIVAPRKGGDPIARLLAVKMEGMQSPTKFLAKLLELDKLLGGSPAAEFMIADAFVGLMVIELRRQEKDHRCDSDPSRN